MDMVLQGCVYSVAQDFGCTQDDVKRMMQLEAVRENIMTTDTIGCGQ